MCLAVPARIVEKTDLTALVEVQGNRIRADLTLVPDAVIGDYVVVHAGFAISKYALAEAEEALALWREIESAGA